MTKRIGVLTTGGDSPGTNAVIRGLGKTSASLGISLIGFQDGFSGMAGDLSINLKGEVFSGILTSGGTLLGTSRDLPDRMQVDGKLIDRTDEILQVYQKHHLDGLVILGGGGAQESGLVLMQKGLNVLTIPVTIDNDVPLTDTSVGFDTAMETAAEAIDRLHSTAISHHRIIIVEVMGRETGWLTLGAGMAGGADVILIPEIPYDFNKISEAILQRRKRGKRFSLVAVSEGAVSLDSVRFFESARKTSERLHSGKKEDEIAKKLDLIEKKAAGDTLHLANQLEKFTSLDTRVTILGYVQRGGAPSAADRMLATQLGTSCAELIAQGTYGVMAAFQSGSVVPVPLEEIAGKLKTVPLDHSWLHAARQVGTCLGD